ncbi:LGSN protein, partial [Horornis vulcanius]|nr:LGSN protein [Horornis vulcanius]
QNTSESDSDEVDGNNICGFRKKRGIKDPTKYVPPLENEKMELSHTSKIPVPCPLKGTTGCSELPSEQSLQNPTTFPPVQVDRGGHDSSNSGSNGKEDRCGETRETQECADTEKRTLGKMHEETDTAQMKLPRGAEKGSCTEAVQREKDSEQARGKPEERGGMEEKVVKFHVTKMGSLESAASMPGSWSCTANAFKGAPGISKRSLQELKNLLSEGHLPSHGPNFCGKTGGTFAQKNLKPREKAADKQGRPFETFSPHFGEEKQKYLSFHKEGMGQQSKTILVLGSAGSDQQQPVGSNVDHLILGLPAMRTNCEGSWEKTVLSHQRSIQYQTFWNLMRLGFHLAFTKQVVRLTEYYQLFLNGYLNGKCRQTNSRFFSEKAIHGIAMPRSYLELTLNPKDNELDYINATNFNCDIILNPDLSTFRILPWTEQTARVICDSFTVLGTPLMTSPRHIAKKQLSQLQDNGFSLHSAFTYEFCIYGITEVVNSKTISFPAATILNNHDQTFIQELIEGMYYAGANIESFSSSTGPGQMEITFHPAFGLDAADSAFTFRTGLKEVAKKYNYVASFFSESGFYNSGALSHSLWDLNGQKNLFSAGYGVEELSELGKNWLSGLLAHTAAISCLMAPTTNCRKPYSKY